MHKRRFHRASVLPEPVLRKSYEFFVGSAFFHNDDKETRK